MEQFMCEKHSLPQSADTLNYLNFTKNMKEAQDGFPMDISYYQWTLDNTPRLRKNRRIEDKWGLKYCAAVKEAIFSERNFPYTPPKPPKFLTESDTFCEKLHTCGQCRDSFQFESSLKDHHARRSWILGLWCQHCFITVCSHTSSNKPPCASCINLDRHKRTYLREKCLKKTLKYGVARVFYNPCQFFDHLSIHCVREVNMSDIMVMPLPSDIDHEWSTELHRACEALIENAFLSDIHISDWLKQQKIENKWWKLIRTDEIDEENRMTEVMKNFRNHDLFGIPLNTFKGLSTDNAQIRIQSSSKRDILVGKQNGTLVHLQADVIESEDNPCLLNDITFVDCGPTPKCFESESLAVAISKRRNTIYVTSDTCTTKDIQRSNYLIKGKLQANNPDVPTKISPPQLRNDTNVTIKEINKTQTQDDKSKSKEGNTTQPVLKTTPNKSNSQSSVNKKLPPLLPKLIRATKKLKTSEQPLKVIQPPVQPPPVVNVNSKILTLQSSKNVDLTTLISQLSPHLNNSKILLIDDGSDGMVVASPNHQKPQSTIDLMQIKDKNQHIIKTVPMKILSLNTPNQSNDSPKEIDTSKSISQQVLPVKNKIIYQNGRRYIIKPSSSNSSPQTPPVTLTPTKPQTDQRTLINSASVSLIESKNKILNSSEVSLTETNIFPKMIPSLSKSLSPSIQLSPIPKQKCQGKNSEKDDTISETNGIDNYHSLSFVMKEDKNLYLKSCTTLVENSNPIHSNAMIPTCRYEMLNEFYQLNVDEIQKRVDHLQKLNTDFARVMYFGSDSIVNENRKVIKLLQHEVLCATASRSESEETNKSIDDTDEVLNNWELDLLQINERPKCELCNKVFKPSSYIPGFSKPAEKDNVYCLCYKYICHLCYTYHGNKEDFMFHHNVHEKKEPSQCPDCSEQFSSFKSLEIHLWTECFHMLKKQFFGCRICQVDGFLDMEALTRHFSIMHGYRKIACEKCNLVLSTFADYEQHCHDKHSPMLSYNPTRLLFCKLDQKVIRCEDYMSHLENHVGVRKLTWYKCPFCRFFSAEMDRNRVFLKPHLHSKHYSRLPEIINIEYLKEIVPGKKFYNLSATTSTNMARFKNNTTQYKDGIVVPKIVNARTITSEVFERGTQDAVDNSIESLQTDQSVNLNNTMLSDVKISVKTSKPVTANAMKVPKILEVRSMAQGAKDSTPVKKTEQPKPVANEPEKILENLFEKAHKSLQYEVATKRAKLMPDKSEGSSDSMGANDLDDLSDSPKVDTIDICEKPMKNLSHMKIYKKKSAINDTCKNNEEGETIPRNLQQNSQPNQTFIPKLPPLSRIPQRIDDTSPSREIEGQTRLLLNPVEEDKNPAGDEMYSKKFNRKRPWRIALDELTPSSADEDCQNYLCHTCGELINTSWSTISAHYKTKHCQEFKLSTVTPRLLRISPDFINGGYKDFYNKKKKLETTMATTAKRRRRWGPKKYTDPHNSSLGLCVKQESAEDGQGLFKCKKCEQRCSDMSNLREHIASNHRIKDRYLICLECGENFVVEPSLQMHLKAFHGIKDPNTYLSQNISYLPDIKDDFESGSKTVVANQCHVCMAVFVDKAAVDKHLRVHGMAFLNRKRIEARNALKNSKNFPPISKESNHCISNESEHSKKTVPQSIVDRVNMAT